MNKKLSLILALAVMLICSLFAFHAFAEDGTGTTLPDVPPVAEQIAIGSSNTSISLSTSSYSYNGKAKTPAVTVKFTGSGSKAITLSKGVDYKVSYSNNINAGKATVKIEGIGDYSGTVIKNFTIKPVSVASKSVSLSLSYYNGVYSGKSKTPIPTVYWNNGKSKVKLVKGRDYTVSYSNNKNMGKATVIIKGIKNFNSTVKKDFKILPKQTTGLKISGTSVNSVSLKWSKQSYVSGYQVLRYDADKKKFVQVKRLSANATSCTVSGLGSATSYRFKVRAFKQLSDGKTNYYGAYSSEASTVTKPARVTLTSVTKSGSSIRVEWKKTKASGYHIYYSTDSKFKKNVKKITVKSSSKTSYKINKVNKKATYYVKVRAYYNHNKSTLIGAFSSSLSTYYSNLYASYTSNYVNNANRTNNLKIASKAISGTIIKPGQTFSFNNVVGPRTSSRGYKAAPVFSSSTNTEDGIGGGICQVASTMFNCALNANVGIVERHQHSQRVSYVPLGRDAAIYGTVQDFRWKNTTKYPIRVVMTVKNGKITCSFYTCAKVKPAKVALKVTRSGKNFTLRRSVNGRVNYTCKSKY